MTHTVFGRWQTRLVLLFSVGSLNTLPFDLGIIEPEFGIGYFLVLVYVALFGCVWDLVYNYLQKFRWDRDWPGALQLLAGIWEAIFLLFCVNFFGLPGLPKVDLFWFTWHYCLVWLSVYIASHTCSRILFHFWLFRG